MNCSEETGGETRNRNMVNYNKLWKLLIDKQMKKKDLMVAANIGSATIAKMTKGMNITTDILCRICAALNCDFKDIMEYIPG